MSTIICRTVQGIAPIKVIPQYLESDYTLVVGPNGDIPIRAHRVSIDTLTLFFTPEGHLLTGLESYTSAERWERHQTLSLPSIDQESALTSLELFDEHGIAPTKSCNLRYIYNQGSALIKIEFGSGLIQTRVRCLSCVILSLGVNGEVLEIWIEKLVIR